MLNYHSIEEFRSELKCDLGFPDNLNGRYLEFVLQNFSLPEGHDIIDYGTHFSNMLDEIYSYSGTCFQIYVKNFTKSGCLIDSYIYNLVSY